MPSPVLTEGFHAGAFLISEANGHLSREVVTINNGGGTELVLQGGLVLARLTADGSYLPYDNVGSDGSETARAILFNPVLIPAGASRKCTIVARLAEVNASELIWADTVDGAGITAGLADLAAAFIIGR